MEVEEAAGAAVAAAADSGAEVVALADGAAAGDPSVAVGEDSVLEADVVVDAVASVEEEDSKGVAALRIHNVHAM